MNTILLHKIQHRWQAFVVHLGLSLLIFLALLAIIVLYWYPGPFIHMGGWQGIKIVGAVDLVLGPLLTLIVFNRAKKSLKWDLSAIAALQLGGLAYGVWVIEGQRPLAQVLIDNTLFVATKADYKSAPNMVAFNDFSGAYPKFVILDMPMSRELVRTTLVSAMVSGNPLHLQTDKYLDARAAADDENIAQLRAWNFELTTKDSETNCAAVEVEASHYRGKVCIGDSGAISVSTQ